MDDGVQVRRHVAAAANAVQAGLYPRAGEEALNALRLDETCGDAWYILAFSRERVGDLTNAFAAYQAAAARLPGKPDIQADLGRVAYALGDIRQAATHFSNHHAANPACVTAGNNLAVVLRDLQQYEAAIGVLKPLLEGNLGCGMLWNTLGGVLSDRGDPAGALPFFEEAVRLDPGSSKARYNLAATRLFLGEPEGALRDCDAALAMTEDPAEIATMRLGRSAMLLCQGRLGEGWDEYEARLDPAYAAGGQFVLDRPVWAPGADIRGKSLLLFGEQGLGDQISFAGAIPDVLAELGPHGRLTIAVESRLVSLFRRAFPQTKIVALTGARPQGRLVCWIPDFDAGSIDLWAPMASTLRIYRRTLESYPNEAVRFRPLEDQLGHWRRRLADLPGLRVGIAWKSLNMEGVRKKFFPRFDQWAPILRTPGLTFVNLQYGECREEIDYAFSRFGVRIWEPSGLDLKDDIEGVAALAAAVDLVIGPSNATTCIAAAGGAPTWIFNPPASWPCQGTEGLPWSPSVRGFVAKAYGEWDEVMGEIASALGAIQP